jgi:hypothetical protein
LQRALETTAATAGEWPQVETVLYTVNKREETERARQSGVVDGLITDVPLVLPAWLRRA